MRNYVTQRNLVLDNKARIEVVKVVHCLPLLSSETS